MRFLAQKYMPQWGEVRGVVQTSAKRMLSFGQQLITEKLCPACQRPFHAPKSIQPPSFTSHTDTTRLVENFLCSHCLPLVQRSKNPHCTLCGHVLAPHTAYPHCLQCQKHPPPWDILFFYAPYTSLVKYCILRYKYSMHLSFIPVLRAFLYAASLSLPPCDILIPVPRHEKRLASQGYNHMLELAHSLQQWLVIPLEAEALWRTRYTVPQMSLPKAQRHKNPQGSFAARPMQGKRVLLLDDVMTTGATLHHACLALRKAGADFIAVLLVAKAERGF